MEYEINYGKFAMISNKYSLQQIMKDATYED